MLGTYSPITKTLIRKNNYHIILISETWLNEKIEIKIPNYNCYRKDRQSNSRYPHGGVAILVHKSVNHAIVECCHLNHIEAIFIKTPCFSNYVTIASVYCPPSLSMIDFKNDIKKLTSIQGAIVLAGDFNAKHQAWNNKTNCRNYFRLSIENQILNNNHLNTTSNSIKSIDNILNYFTDILEKVSNISIPKKFPYTFKYPFSVVISQLTRERNRQRNRFSRSLDPIDKKLLNSLNKQIKQKSQHME